MGVFEMVAVVSVSGIGLAAYAMHIKSKSVQVDDSLKDEVDQLRERVATLEKIVTEQKFNLKNEIDSL